jgi:hypothetical protein
MKAIRHILAAMLAVATPAVASSVAVTVAVTPVAAQARGCGSGYYLNSRGNCVPRPVQSSTVPEGATAQCRDGSYSFSQSRRGTCSHHGGVARWL